MLPSSSNKVITKDEVIQTYKFMIFSNMMYDGRNVLSKRKGFLAYKSTIETFFKILSQHSFKTNNLLDVYKNPLRYVDITAKNKKILQILYKLYTLSDKGKFPVDKIPQSIIHLAKNANNIREFMKNFSILQNRDKENEHWRMMHSPYYDWEEIKKIPSLITKNTARDLKDLILIRIYVEENVVRDNLGLLKILHSKPTTKVDYNYIYKTQNGRYIISLNDFKNVNFRGSHDIKLHADLGIIIDSYLEKMRILLKNTNLEYLICKDDGSPYSNGSLSSYITRMFKKYTRAQNLGINALRHSVATFYKNESVEFKADLAQKMQHSLTQHLKYERHSNKVIKLPVFNPVVINENMIGKRVSVLIHEGKYTNKHLEGTVFPNTNTTHPHKNDFPYEIRFDFDDEPHEVVSEIPSKEEGITLI